MSAEINQYIQIVSPGSELHYADIPSTELFSQINVRSEQRDTLFGPDKNPLELALPYSTNSVSIYSGDKLIMLAGIVPMWCGVGELWALVDEDIMTYYRRDPRAFIKAVRMWMALTPYHRVQTPVREGFDAGTRFARFFGFKPEGLMTAYGPKRENYFRYAYVRGE